MRLVCSWRRLLDHSDCWVAQTNGRAGSAVTTCINTMKAGWHTRCDRAGFSVTSQKDVLFKRQRWPTSRPGSLVLHGRNILTTA
eukprot:scaffold2815_cov113-Isochrysis_galbana.AAC.8